MPFLSISEEEYLKGQVKDYCSFESKYPHWIIGQRRYLESNLLKLNTDLSILDVACGDGVGLDILKEFGFHNIIGADINMIKTDRARKNNHTIFDYDIRYMPGFKNEQFDIVYSSHTLEHVANPVRAIDEIKRVLKNDGTLYVVLPYPDNGPDLAHFGKYELGTDIDDNGERVINYFVTAGFEILDCTFDSFREEEIWLKMRKVSIK